MRSGSSSRSRSSGATSGSTSQARTAAAIPTATSTSAAASSTPSSAQTGDNLPTTPLSTGVPNLGNLTNLQQILSGIQVPESALGHAGSAVTAQADKPSSMLDDNMCVGSLKLMSVNHGK